MLKFCQSRISALFASLLAVLAAGFVLALPASAPPGLSKAPAQSPIVELFGTSLFRVDNFDGNGYVPNLFDPHRTPIVAFPSGLLTSPYVSFEFIQNAAVSPTARLGAWSRTAPTRRHRKSDSQTANESLLDL